MKGFGTHGHIARRNGRAKKEIVIKSRKAGAEARVLPFPWLGQPAKQLRDRGGGRPETAATCVSQRMMSMNIRPSNLLSGESLDGYPPQPRTRALRGMIAIAVLLVLTAAAVWYFLAGPSTPRQRAAPPPPVRVVVAQQKNVTGFEHLIGTG